MLQNKIKISCIIPTCDRPEYLKQALDSIFKQTYKPGEIIVVNNGKESLDLKDERYKNIKVYNIIPYVGVSQARNFGASLASGDYLAFLDDDDLWSENYLENTLKAIESGAQCILSRIDYLDKDKVSLAKNPHRRLSVENLYTFNPGVIGSNIVVSKNIFIQVGGFDTKLVTSEDKSLIIEILKRKIKIATLPDSQVLWRVHQIERLTDSDKLAEGIYLFNQKYRQSMKKWQYFYNLSKVYRHKLRIGEKRFIIHFFFVKLLFYFFKSIQI
ncbi:MAG: glycosyltransferase [Patescibacteria group bacterium]